LLLTTIILLLFIERTPLERLLWAPGVDVDIRFGIESFVTLTVIIDPIGNVPIFLGVTHGKSSSARGRLAGQAVLVAAGVLAIFGVLGKEILSYLGISLPALQVSGGLLLLLVALEILTGRYHGGESPQAGNVALVPLATPLIAGPGAIAAVLVYAREVHSVGTGITLGLAVALALVVLYLVLRLSTLLQRLLRESGIELLTRIFGLLLAAIAVQLGFSGLHGFGF